jgi:L-aminopeptidase/D-esterase-like protein
MGAIAGVLKGGLGSASFIYQQGTEEVCVGALAAVNSVGSVLLPDSPVMWAAPYEQKNELGGQAKLDYDYKMKLDFTFPDLEVANTTLVVVATNISLSRAQAKRIAIMAQDGLARAIRPVHSPYEQKNELGGQAKLDYDYKMKLDFTFPDLEVANTTLVVVATNISLSRAQAKRIAIMAQDGLARAIRPVHSPFDGDTVFVMSTEEKVLSNPATNLAKLGMLAADCVTRAVARGVFEAETLGDWESYQSRYGPFLNKLNRGEFE